MSERLIRLIRQLAVLALWSLHRTRKKALAGAVAARASYQGRGISRQEVQSPATVPMLPIEAQLPAVPSMYCVQVALPAG